MTTARCSLLFCVFVFHVGAGLQVMLQDSMHNLLQNDTAPLTATRPFRRLYPVSLSAFGVRLVEYDTRHIHQLLKPQKEALHRREALHANAVVEMPFGEYIEYVNAKVLPPRPTFFMFKVGRCGSTLMDKMLLADSNYLLVAEPVVFNEVAVLNTSMKPHLLQALVTHLSEPLTEQQKALVIDFNSHSSYLMSEIVDAVPHARGAFLWRKAIEVAESYYNKPAGWLRDDMKLHSIKEHLEKSVSAVGVSSSRMHVFWYQQVRDGSVLRWIIENAFPEITHATKTVILARMLEKAKLHSQTGKPWPSNYVDHNEITASAVIKNRQAGIWYNPTLIKFGTVHSPIALYKAKMTKIKELHWPRDKVEIGKHLCVAGSLRDEPVIIRGAMGSTGFADKRPGQIMEMLDENIVVQRRNFQALHANHLENQFVWHPPKVPHGDYEVYAEWTNQTWQAWKNDSTKYIVDRAPLFFHEKLMLGNSTFRLFNPSGNVKEEMSFRVSHEGAVSPLHFDAGDSVLMQLEGSKELLLWPPTELDNLYPYGPDHFMHRRLLADPEYPDTELLPKFNVTAAVVAEVRFGDMAYWPRLWAHYIRTTEGPSVSAGMRYHGPMAHFYQFKWATDDLIQQVQASGFAKGTDRNVQLFNDDDLGETSDPDEHYIPR